MTSFEEMFFKLIDEQKEPYKPTYPTIPHANASDAQDCFRKVSLKLFKIKRTNNISTSTITLHIGNVIDKLAKEAILKTYKVSETDVYFFNGFLSGKADAIIEENGERVVVEIKSCNAKTYKFVKKNNAPNTSNYFQATITANHFKIKKVKIIYVCKEYIEEDNGILVFDLPVDEFETKFEVQKFERIVDMQRKGIVAERFYNGEVITDPSKVKFPCSYCPYYNLCLRLKDDKIHIGEVLKEQYEMTEGE